MVVKQFEEKSINKAQFLSYCRPSLKATLEMEFELFDSPTDGITSLNFSKYSPDLLLCSSWDKNVRLYNSKLNQLVANFHHKAPVLDCCFATDSVGYSGGMEKKLRAYKYFNLKESTL